MVRGTIAVVATLLATSVEASSGVVIQFEQPEGITTYMAQGKKLRTERGGQGGEIMIFDGDAQTLYRLNTSDRTYTAMTEADAQGISAQIDAMLAKMPPEQRAKAEQLMNQRRGGAAPMLQTKYEPTGKRETVAGYSCQGYRVLREGEATQEGCFIPWSANVVKKEDLAALVEFGNFLGKFLSTSMRAGHRSTGLAIADMIDRAPGFPAIMQHASTDGSKPENTERLVSVKHTGLASETFTVPAGYTKVEMRGFGSGVRARSGKP